MSSSDFSLITDWELEAPIEQVWAALTTPEQWPTWWPAVIAVKTLEAGDAEGIGAYREMTWRTALPYRLAFNMRTVRVVKHELIEGVADGNLEGCGRWTLSARGPTTVVRYEWRVAVTKPWMRLLAPLLRPAFAWNHGVVMEWGRKGLLAQLGLSSIARRGAHPASHGIR